jgi:hypothetical protein
MYCSKCGSFLAGQQSYCPNCGTAIAAAVVPATAVPARATSLEERLWKARVWVGLICVVFAIVLTFSLQPVAGWIGIIASAIFAIGWSLKSIQYRHKIAFVMLSVFLVAGVQWVERVQVQERAAKHQAKLDQIASQSASAARLRAQQEEDTFNKMTPAQHLAAAKEDLKANSFNGQIAEGLKHLQALHGTPLEAQGSALRTHYESEKAQAEKTAAAEAAASVKRAKAESQKQEILGRNAMAKTIEDGMLSQGYDIDVNAIGPNHTILRIKFILVNKAFAYQTAHSPEIIDSARGAGFKKIVLTDGYDEQWHIDL